MTELLEKAFREAAKLPPKAQDAIAALLLAELEAERRWDDLFARSQKELTKLADDALRDENTGETEDLLPDKL